MKSLIGYEGLPETQHFAGSLNYIYGLSDFWTYWFQDKEILDRTLEATSMQLAEIYSRFLQNCSSISLEDIRTTFHSDLKLLLIKDTDAVVTNPATYPYGYRINVPITNIGYLFDKPMFPGKTYERNIHFRVEADGTDSSILYLTTPISGLGLPVRKIVVNGAEVNQYSLWASDVEVDEQTLWSYFGRFVRVTPATSTKLFKDYIQGLYFLYVNGPTVELLSRGLNLALGIPLARETEMVIKIVTDPETGNYSIITPNNSYTIPYQIPPIVEVGDILDVGKEISWVASVQDYKTNGSWWINLAMPRQLFPSRPSNIPTVAVEGGDIDYFMKKFLKTHTFLVKIDIAAEFSAESMAELARLVIDAKPVYTYPVLVWSIPILQDDLLEQDDDLVWSQQLEMYDSMVNGEYLSRDHEEEDIAGERSCRVFIHGNGDLTGYAGVTVNVIHEVVDGVSGSTMVSITDSFLIPLWNITLTDLKEVITALGIALPVEFPKRFRVWPVNLTAAYSTVVVRDPLSTTPGISYNTNNINGWDGEVHRCFIPSLASLNAFDQLVFMEVEHGLYSAFLLRNPQTLFTPVFFPPAEEDPLIVTQVPV